MTENKVEEILKRIGSELDDGEWRGLDPHKLAQVLVEMDQNMNIMYRLLTAVRKVEPEDWATGDVKEDNESYKAGYLAALEELERNLCAAISWKLGVSNDLEFSIKPLIRETVDELKKKYD